ncbi:hypothetical protein LSAT2_003209 [Lamellibrachia satsuma]|nr:hypothetical protein LSAT2_003209 [Lamellibrachia satsuma]
MTVDGCTVLCHMLIRFLCFFSPRQLRVVRAFRRTLEDIEDIRSTRSFQSLHSIRSLRGSHLAHHRPLSDELCHYIGTTVGADWNGSRLREQNGSYTNMAMCAHESLTDNVCRLSIRSRSADNVSVTDSGATLPCAAMPPGGVLLSVSPHNRSSPNMRLRETSI